MSDAHSHIAEHFIGFMATFSLSTSCFWNTTNVGHRWRFDVTSNPGGFRATPKDSQQILETQGSPSLHTLGSLDEDLSQVVPLPRPRAFLEAPIWCITK